jgi:hypothetical protein
MKSNRKNSYKHALHALRGERLPRGHIFGMQALAGELAVEGVRLPLRYIKTAEQDPMQEQRERSENRESFLLDSLHQQIRQRGTELIDPTQVAWPEVS